MAAFNKFWTLLGRDSTNSLGRAVTDGLYKPKDSMLECHALLVPDTEQSYSGLCVEQLLQVVMQSSLRDSLLSSDSFNTYDRPISFSMQTTNSISKSYAGIDVYITDEGTDGWTTATFTVVLNSSSMQASISSSLASSSTQTFSITDNMSSKIALSTDFYLRFRGSLPVGLTNITVISTLKFNRSIKDILDKLAMVSVPWINQEYRKLYLEDPMPVNKLAAVVMNLYEGLSDG